MARIQRLVCRPVARWAVTGLTCVRAVGRGHRRATRPSGARVDHVRPDTSKGSRAVHQVSGDHADRSALAGGAPRSAFAAHPGQPDRIHHDLAASHADRRRGHRQARRHHARVRHQQRTAEATRRGSRPRGRIGAQRHCRPAWGPAASRGIRARRRGAAPRDRLRIFYENSPAWRAGHGTRGANAGG